MPASVPEARSETPRVGLVEAVVLTLAVIAAMLLVGAGGEIWLRSIDPLWLARFGAQGTVLYGIATMAYASALAVLVAWGLRRRWSLAGTLALRPVGAADAVLAVAVGLASFLVTARLLGNRPGLLVSMPASELAMLALALRFVAVGLLAPLVEEVLFRRVLFIPLAGASHWLVAALVTTLVWTLLHPLTSIFALSLIAIQGLMLAAVARGTGSISYGLIAHVAHNVAAALWAVLV
ncbi:MAG: CPBP family intramembrane glutamic endopeptidase [Hyphomicrobiaceae bacterium]